MVKVSIVMPVYNAANYLHRMVDSILNQTFADWELIAVDDGSKDSTYAILTEYSRKDSRIRAIHQENKGCGSSRCTALGLVVGDYVVCLDSDDWLEPDYLEQLYGIASGNYVDLVWCDVYKNISEYWSFRCEESPETMIKTLFMDGMWLPVWNKMVKRDIVKGVDKYLEGCNQREDVVFCIYCLCKSKRINYLAKPLYHYNTQNENSMINTAIYRDVEGEREYSVSRVSEIFQDMGLTNKYEYEFNYYKLSLLFCFIDDEDKRNYSRFLNTYPEAIQHINEYATIPKRLKVSSLLIKNRMSFLVPSVCKFDKVLRSLRLIH